MNISVSDWLITGISLGAAVVQIYILSILLKRKLRSDFPVFAVYNALAAFTALILAVPYLNLTARASSQYFLLFWGLNGIVMILEFGIIYEIFVNALKPYDGLIDLGRMLFAWAAAFLLVTAVLTAVATAGPLVTKCVAALALVQKTLRLMQCGLLLLFFLFERRLALSWRSYPVSLAMGLGVFAGLGFTLSFLRVHFAEWTSTFDIADNASYFAVVAYWAFCFAQPEPARKNVLDSPRKLIFQRWNEALLAGPLGAHDRNTAVASVDSFLPGIEKTVDKILARKIAN